MTAPTEGGISREQPLPSWASIREQFAEQQQRPPAWHQTAQWMLDVLEGVLGGSWPERAAQQFGEVPIPVILASGHTLAFVYVLELAARCRLLAEVNGFARARKELRGHRELGRVQHFMVQTTLAGLAQSLAWRTQIEPGQPPADLWFEAGSRRITVETRVLQPSDAERRRQAAIDRANDRLRSTSSQLGVWTAGDTSEPPSEDELDAAVAWIRENAETVRGGGHVHAFRTATLGLELVSSEGAQGKALRSAPGSENLLVRLVSALNAKARKMQASGPEWLCLETLTGMFLLTEWGWMDMEHKVAILEDAVRLELAPPPYAGYILCSGASHFNGPLNEETTVTPTGATGLRYPITPMRAREVIVVPLRDTAAKEVPLWRGLFAAEREWLPRALNVLDLPTLDAMFPIDSGS